MAYKPITSAPVCSAPTGRLTLLPEPKNVRSVLRRLGYEWEPGAKLIVRFTHQNKIEAAYAFIGSASALSKGVICYCLREAA